MSFPCDEGSVIFPKACKNIIDNFLTPSSYFCARVFQMGVSPEMTDVVVVDGTEGDLEAVGATTAIPAAAVGDEGPPTISTSLVEAGTEAVGDEEVEGATISEVRPVVVEPNPVKASTEDPPGAVGGEEDEGGRVTDGGMEAVGATTSAPEAVVAEVVSATVKTNPVEPGTQAVVVEEDEGAPGAVAASMAVPIVVETNPVEASTDEDDGDGIVLDRRSTTSDEDGGEEWLVVGKRGRVMARLGAQTEVRFSVKEVRMYTRGL